jgi:hypothetical protein
MSHSELLLISALVVPWEGYLLAMEMKTGEEVDQGRERSR